MENNLSVVLEEARQDDVRELISLYSIIYGRNYPLAYGNDPDVLLSAINDKKSHLVLVARIPENDAIGGAVIVEKEVHHKIGKVVGLVVHPDFQRLKIAHQLVSYLSHRLLEDENELNSLYATTRTVTVGPQMVFLKNGYLPLGVFPNAHRLKRFESVTLMTRFRKGLLERRDLTVPVSMSTYKLYSALSDQLPSLAIPSYFTREKPLANSDNHDWEFEIIQAPEYVMRRFKVHLESGVDFYFPFHKPNILFSEKNGKLDIFGYFSQPDGYCVLLSATKPTVEFTGELLSFFAMADSIGISYLEVVMNTNNILAIENLLACQFLPSAIYPGYREVNGKPVDYVFMSRTMEPLNFRGMSVLAPFKPYIDQYVDAWKKQNLDGLEVIHGPKS